MPGSSPYSRRRGRGPPPRRFFTCSGDQPHAGWLSTLGSSQLILDTAISPPSQILVISYFALNLLLNCIQGKSGIGFYYQLIRTESRDGLSDESQVSELAAGDPPVFLFRLLIHYQEGLIDQNPAPLEPPLEKISRF